MQVIICEDDLIHRKLIQEKIEHWIQLAHHETIHVMAYTSSEIFLEQWKKGMKADILFLDIHFQSETTGMEIAKQVRLTDEYVPIVFVTNSEAYVKEGYAVRAFRYLSKPIRYDDIALCLDVAYKQYTLAHNEFLIMADAGRRLALRHEDILYFEAQSPYMRICMYNESNSMKIRYRFLDILPKLPEELFIPCHRSYIVNIMHVRCVKRNELILSTGQVLPVSRPYVKRIDYAFDNYYQEGGASCHVDGV